MRSRNDGLWDAVILSISVLPFILLPHLPLADWPDHLARQYVIAALPHSERLQAHYGFGWRFVPNLGFDLFVQAFRHAIGIEAAARLFLVTVFGAWFIGVRSIARFAWGDASRWYRLTPILFYSGPVQFGFASYIAGVAVAVLGFAWFLRACRDGGVAHWIGLAALSALAVTAHMSGFLVYAASAGGYLLFFRARKTLARHASLTDWLRDAVRMAHLLPGIALFLAGTLIAKADGTPAASAQMEWRVLWKLEALVSPIMFNLPYLELAIGAVLAAILLALLATRRVDLRADLAVPALILLALAIVLPSKAFDGAYIDYRLPTASCLFLLGALGPGAGAPAPGVLLRLPAAAGFIVALRIALAAGFWWSWQPVYQSFEAAFAELPLGARIYAVEGLHKSTAASKQPPITHWPALAAARREALFGNIFANLPSQHLLTIPQNNGQFRQVYAEPTFDLSQAANYDYLFVLLPDYVRLVGERGHTPIYTDPKFVLYRLGPE